MVSPRELLVSIPAAVVNDVVEKASNDEVYIDFQQTGSAARDDSDRKDCRSTYP